MGTYTKQQVKEMADEVIALSASFDNVKPRSINMHTLVGTAENAETIAIHAGYNDMPFVATNMLAIASKLNRLLVLRLAS